MLRLCTFGIIKLFLKSISNLQVHIYCVTISRRKIEKTYYPSFNLNIIDLTVTWSELITINLQHLSLQYTVYVFWVSVVISGLTS